MPHSTYNRAVRTRPFHTFLLFLALALGQWVTLAHASEHAVVQSEQALCEYCVSGIGSGPASAPPVLPDFPRESAAYRAHAAHGARASARHTPRLSQGPPQHV